MDRAKKLKLNTVMGFIYQVVAIICGFIIPRLILQTYGSETNGLVNSIQSILNVITLMELGVGAVVQTALYKPLALNDEESVSRIVSAAKKFFRMVGLGFVLLVIGVICIYPAYVSDKYDVLTTVLLISAISITMFAQYFFGIVYSLLIQADQKVYVYNIIQIIALVLNTVACATLMLTGFSIQTVKFVTAAIFLLRPLLLTIYVKKYYNIYKVKVVGDEIPQKWNGIAQHIASYVLENTDILILTFFVSLAEVSVYSTYYLIVHSIKLVIVALSNGMKSYLGNLLALDKKELLKKEFERLNFILSSVALIVFAITVTEVVPFVMCYTKGVTDTDYNRYIFGFLITIGQFFDCKKRLYNIIILAAGHYKQTQLSSIIEASINAIISMIVVFKFGIIGVTLGTIIALFYRCCYYAWYNSKNIIERPMILFYKDLILDSLLLFVAFLIGLYINENIVINNFGHWILYAIGSSAIIGVVFLIVNLLFNRKLLIGLIKGFFIRNKSNEEDMEL